MHAPVRVRVRVLATLKGKTVNTRSELECWIHNEISFPSCVGVILIIANHQTLKVSLMLVSARKKIPLYLFNLHVQCFHLYFFPIDLFCLKSERRNQGPPPPKKKDINKKESLEKRERIKDLEAMTKRNDNVQPNHRHGACICVHYITLNQTNGYIDI